MTPERFARLRRALDRRQPDLTVLLENVHKPHNFAAVLRSADAVGCLEAHAIVPESELPTSLTSAAGIDRWLRVTVHRAADDAITALREQRFRLVAAHPAPAAIDFRAIDLTRPSAVVLGQEKDGLTAETLAAVDDIVSIPMTGLGRSLNVSVAAALILFEAQRQRSASGLYERCRLEPATRGALLFEWAYPRVASLCRRRGVAYPELGDDGEILGEVPR